MRTVISGLLIATMLYGVFVWSSESDKKSANSKNIALIDPGVKDVNCLNAANAPDIVAVVCMKVQNYTANIEPAVRNKDTSTVNVSPPVAVQYTFANYSTGRVDNVNPSPQSENSNAIAVLAQQ